MVDDNSRWLDRNKAEALEANKKNPVARTTLLVNYTMANTIIKGLQGTGDGLVDFLEYGEWERTGNGMGFLRDGFRAMAFVDAAGAVRTMPRTLAPLLNRFVPGGPASCVLTSLTKGLNLSGQSMRVRLDPVAQTLNLTQAQAVSPSFAGIGPADIPLLSGLMNKIGHQTTMVQFPNPGKFDLIVDDLWRAVHATGDPHTIALGWKSGGGHVMTAYPWRGGMQLTDQFGTWIPKIGPNGSRTIINIDPTSLARSSGFLSIESAVFQNAANVIRLHGVQTVPRSFTLLDAAGHALLGADPTFVPVVPISADELIRLVSPKPKLFNLPNFDHLKKPKQEPVAQPAPNLIYHQVRAGDTLFGLAKHYFKDAAKFQVIMKYNGLRPIEGNRQLPIGTKLAIPKAAS